MVDSGGGGEEPVTRVNSSPKRKKDAMGAMGDGKGGMPGAMGGTLHPETGAALINLPDGGKMGADMMMGGNGDMINDDGEDPPTLRERIMAFMDGKFMQTTMTVLTFFALYGDDLRSYASYKQHDPLFYVLYIITFLLFAFELTVFSICKEDYKWSFFFWLDMIASLSLTIDVKWFHTIFESLFDVGDGTGGGQANVARAGRASRAGTRAGRIVRLIRLVRLLRVVNVSKLFQREQKSELDEHVEHEQGQQKQETGDQTKKVEASRLGKILSEQTTRTVIIGVREKNRF